MDSAGRIDVLREGDGDWSVANDDRVRGNREGEREQSDEGLAEEHVCDRRELKGAEEQESVEGYFIGTQRPDKGAACEHVADSLSVAKSTCATRDTARGTGPSWYAWLRPIGTETTAWLPVCPCFSSPKLDSSGFATLSQFSTYSTQ